MKRGFTLIEIMVATAIMAITLGVSISGYNNFNEGQRVKQAALTFKNNARMAQEKAKSAQRPFDPTCVKLEGYHVIRISATKYQVRDQCLNSSGGLAPNTPQEFTLPTNVSFLTANFDIFFRPLTQNAASTVSVVFQSSQSSVVSTVTVNQNGEISIN
jgi:prepilin-type N-terminal cleavage/methylation domain-containing protein